MKDLTIIIPTKNEEKHIGKLLQSINCQTYDKSKIKVFVADANSTDKTCGIVKSFEKDLDVEIINGGLPATGRNNGAYLAETPYILFIDADVILQDENLLKKVMNKVERKKLKILTANIKTMDKDIRAKILYFLSNMVQHLSKLHKPFATGMFMLIDKNEFHRIGGFDEKVMYAEDYFFSKNFERKNFSIMGKVYTPARRFRKMGYLHILRMFIKTATNTNNKEYFYKDQKYWENYNE